MQPKSGQTYQNAGATVHIGEVSYSKEIPLDIPTVDLSDRFDDYDYYYRQSTSAFSNGFSNGFN